VRAIAGAALAQKAKAFAALSGNAESGPLRQFRNDLPAKRAKPGCNGDNIAVDPSPPRAHLAGLSRSAAMTKAPLITPVLIAGCVILMISFAIRASFGVFQIPVAEEFGWARAEFSLAIAIQNLAWGIGQPLFGALAERFGDRRAIIAGALLYAAGWCSRPMR
jgi:hypothetical protein